MKKNGYDSIPVYNLWKGYTVSEKFNFGLEYSFLKTSHFLKPYSFVPKVKFVHVSELVFSQKRWLMQRAGKNEKGEKLKFELQHRSYGCTAFMTMSLANPFWISIHCKAKIAKEVICFLLKTQGMTSRKSETTVILPFAHHSSLQAQMGVLIWLGIRPHFSAMKLVCIPFTI